MKKLFKTYGLWGSFQIILYKLFTVFFIKQGRLVRLPIDIRGKDNIDFGTKLTTGKYCRLEAIQTLSKGKKIIFGNDVIINDMVHIAAIESIKIGNNVLVGSKVFITDHNHGQYGLNGDSPEIIPNQRPIVSRPVVIEDNVWIGEFVSILPGVKIGKGSVIGTMSVVTKDIPPFSIAVGSPAKVIKRFNYKSNEWQST